MKFSSLAVLVLALPTASAFSPSFISTERLMRKEQKLEEIAAATAAVEVKRKALEEELAYINFEKSSLEKEAKKMEYGNPVLSAASGAVATTAALCTLFAASNALAPKYVNEHLTKTGSNPSEIIIPKKVVAPKVEQKKPQQASALKVEQKKSAPSPALKVEEKKPVPVPMPKVEVKKPEPVPVLKVEQMKPESAPAQALKVEQKKPEPVSKVEEKKPAPALKVEQKKAEPALKVEGKKPEPAPALKVEQKKPSPAPVQKVEAKKLDTSPALKVQQKKTEPASTTVVPFDFDDNMKVAIAGAAALALVGIAGASAISDNIGTVKSKQKTGYTNGADNGSYFDNMSEPAAVKPKQEVAFNKLSYPVQSTLPPRPPARSSFDNVSATANVKREQRTGNTNGAGNESYFDRMSAPAAMKPEQEESSIKSGIGSFFNNMSAPFRSNSPSPPSFGASSTPANAGSMNGAGNGSYFDRMSAPVTVKPKQNVAFNNISNSISPRPPPPTNGADNGSYFDRMSAPAAVKPKQNVAFNNISNSISPRPPPPANEADNGSYFDRMSAPAAVKPKQNVAFNNISFSQQPRPPVGASFDNISAVANVKRNQRTTNANGAGNESYFDNMSAPATVKPKQQVAFNNISTSQQPPPPAVSTSAPEPISEPILDPRQASATESYFDNVSAAANVKPKTKIGSTNRDKIRSYFDRMSAPAAVKPKQKEASIATGITSFFNNISGPVQSTPEPIWETMPVPEPVPESPRSYLNVISAPANNWNDDVSSKSNIYD